MSYLRHLEFCNRFDPERFLPLLLAGRRVGFIRRDNARRLDAFPHIFRVSDDAVALVDTIEGGAAATQALGEATDGLIRAGVVKPRRNEMFAITDGWGGPLLFEAICACQVLLAMAQPGMGASTRQPNSRAKSTDTRACTVP